MHTSVFAHLCFSSIDHAGEDLGGRLVVLRGILHLIVLLLEFIEPRDLLLNRLLSDLFLVLLRLDLLRSPSPLGTGLEHVGTNSLLCCRYE